MSRRLRLGLILLTLVGALYPCHAQNNEWTWMAGSDQRNQLPSYGTLQTFSAASTPGSRSGMASWTDNSGNLWIFGGTGFDSLGPANFSDLWQWSASAHQWAWMNGQQASNQPGVYGTLGTAAAGNHPGTRSGAVTWTDSSGGLWLFGGQGRDSAGNVGYLNDLWRFSTSTLQWTWMGGASILPTCPSTNSCGPAGVYGTLGTPAPGNIPPGRSHAVGWTDSAGNFWLFGGRIYTVYADGWGGYENDLWKYSPSAGQWAWMGGSSSLPSSCTLSMSCGQPGTYGTLRTPASANIPGAREHATTWVDTHGILWLFGGFSFDAAGLHGYSNDLWSYDPAANQWTWISGSNSVGSSYGGPSGVYGDMQIPAALNAPGGREAALHWRDANGKLWLFGGNGFDATGQSGYLSDLWMFDPGTNQWSWMNGNTATSQPAIFGTLGTPSPGTDPGNLTDASAWSDKDGNFWLFGGSYSNSLTDNGERDDLWEYIPYPPNGLSTTAAPSFSPAPGTYTSGQSVSISSSTPNAAIYYRINGNNPTLYIRSMLVPWSETITAVAAAPGYATSQAVTASYTLQLPPTPEPTFDPVPGTYYGDLLVSIKDSDSLATIYYTTDGSTPTISSQVYYGAFWVTASETIKAIALTRGNSASPAAAGAYTLLPVPPNNWAWLRGNHADEGGNYGLLGVTAALNYPGAREGAASWVDASGAFWIFGGAGNDADNHDGWLNDLWKFDPNAPIEDGLWTWMGGSNRAPCYVILEVRTCTGASGVYGTQGVGSTANIPGGRRGAATWTDASGKLWLFGGYGIDSAGKLGYLNDLWTFDPSTQAWTWISGSSTNQLMVLAEAYGQAGVYGTLGTSDPANVPGTRTAGASWSDTSGNLWLFGGQGIDAGGQLAHLNDLWMFNPKSGQWTWMGGVKLAPACDTVVGHCGAPGIYGALGTPSDSNAPGGRQLPAFWTDNTGNFWLFGGEGFDSNGEMLPLNDMWMFSPSTKQWTWEAGASAVSCPVSEFSGYPTCVVQPSTLGTLGVASPSNTPGGRNAPATWVDQQGNLWLFGGNYPFFGTDNLADMWTFSPTSKQWTWMGGEYKASNCVIVFYILGPSLYPELTCAGNQGRFQGEYVFNIGDLPGARSSEVSLVDHSGNFWLFSGYVQFPTDFGGIGSPVNDSWLYQPSAKSLPAAANPVFSLLPGTYVAGGPLSISNGMANATFYYTTDGSTPNHNSTLYTGPITISSTVQLRAIASVPGYTDSGVTLATYTFPAGPPPAPTFSLAPGTYPHSQTLTLTDADPTTVIRYTLDGSQPTTSSMAYMVPIAISATTTVNAAAEIDGLTVWKGPAFADLIGYSTPGQPLLGPVSTASYSIVTGPAAAPTFSVPAGTYTSAQTVKLSDSTPGAAIYFTTDGTTPTAQSHTYSAPIAVGTSETIKAFAAASGFSDSPVASAVYIINLPPPGFTINAAPASLTVNAGGQGNIVLTVTPQNGFQSPVTFSCSGLPSGTACSFSPTSVTPNGGAATTALTISTTSASAQSPRNPLWPSSVLTLAACVFIFRRRFRSFPWVVAAFVAAGLCIFTGCSGGGSVAGGATPPAPRTYQVTVTATSGTLSQTATISLTVD